jgi:hypothetical protein
LLAKACLRAASAIRSRSKLALAGLLLCDLVSVYKAYRNQGGLGRPTCQSAQGLPRSCRSVTSSRHAGPFLFSVFDGDLMPQRPRTSDEVTSASPVPLSTAAHVLRISWHRAWRLIHIGQLEGRQDAAGRWYVSAESLERQVGVMRDAGSSPNSTRNSET